MDNITVSVIIPTYNEEKYIAGCLDSVVRQDYPSRQLEILVIDGNSEDRTRDIVLQYALRFPNIKLLDNPRRIQVYALNIGIAGSRGEYIVRMDAHSVYEPDYISRCIHLLNTTEAANVGGVQRATGLNYVGKAIALAMSSPFGVGNAYFRYVEKEMFVDSVFCGAWKKATLLELGGYNEEYQINEDYELNWRLRERGGKILLSPAIKCRYYVRDSISRLARQYFRYGLWKLKTLNQHPQSLVYRHLVPFALLLGLVASAVIAPFNWKIALIVPGLYLLANLIFSLKNSFRHGMRYFPILPVIFAAMHLSYGAGFACGLFRYGIPPVGIKGIINSFRAVEKL